ncbi:MAG TPA: sugar ABC transporter ATP-binding protein [Mycobacteriales bacterium]|nr:sugar ABC transporter ATP-binding protein [Mycobacteriales bacterium]
MDEPTVVIDVRQVSKRFLGVVALDQVSLQLRAGEVHALIGENGAGKSTLIKLITGVYQADDGEVVYLGNPVRFAQPRDAQAAGISTIYQEINLIPQVSVARNLFLGREPTGRGGLIDLPRMNREATEVVKRYGVDVDVRRPLRELATGIQQMVAIARAVESDAKVVIMDEPTSSLEPREVDQLFAVIDQLRQRGVAVLYVSHKLAEVFRICDRVTVLRDGRRVHTGPVKDMTRLSLIATMLGRDVADVSAHGTTSFSEEHDLGDRAPVLRASGLTRAHLLHGVAVDVRPGEVVGLAGLLGSGRSETAKAIFGAQPLDAGEVHVDGKQLHLGRPAAAIEAGVALLPEDRKAEGIIPGLSVRENIALAALPRMSRGGFVAQKQIDGVVDTFMKRLRIKASSPDQKVGELSGGNQQKVLLARLLCLNPKVLILDEPTRGIDVGAKAEVQALIDELAGNGLAVLLISSELSEVVEGSDSVVVLRDGAALGTLRGKDISEDRIMGMIAEAASDTRTAHA